MEMPRLETPRLILREFEIDDLDEFASSYADPEVMRFLGDGRVRSREETQAKITAAIFRWQQYRLPLWAVVSRDDGRWMGRCGFQPKDDSAPEIVELAYSFARWTWGCGYATEAARAAINYAFDELGWERIIARSRPGNLASLRVMQKLGFHRERDIVNCHGGPAIRCALTKAEFM
jgi:RimJ/RimL family protein N-acetyltransferase